MLGALSRSGGVCGGNVSGCNPSSDNYNRSYNKGLANGYGRFVGMWEKGRQVGQGYMGHLVSMGK